MFAAAGEEADDTLIRAIQSWMIGGCIASVARENQGESTERAQRVCRATWRNPESARRPSSFKRSQASLGRCWAEACPWCRRVTEGIRHGQPRRAGAKEKVSRLDCSLSLVSLSTLLITLEIPNADWEARLRRIELSDLVTSPIDYEYIPQGFVRVRSIVWEPFCCSRLLTSLTAVLVKLTIERVDCVDAAKE
jgi:hypothetical protein